MYCEHCHHENSDQARYCEMCGADLKEQRSYAEKCTWYYLYKQIARGPFAPEELITLYQLGVIQNDTLLTRNGLKRWVRTDEVLKPDPASDKSAKSEGYYLYRDHKTVGPYPKNKLKELVENFGLAPSDLIWQPGAADWIRADASDFSAWFKEQAQAKIAENTWYILENEVPVALSKKELIALIEQGQVQPEEKIWTPALKKWVPLENSVLAQFIPLSVDFPTMKNEREWLVYQNGAQKGPFSCRQLENFIVSGTVSDKDQVYKEGMKQPLPLSKSRFLKNLDGRKGWYLMEDEEASGPFEERDVAGLLRSDMLAGTLMAWQAGMEEWVPLEQCQDEILERNPTAQQKRTKSEARELDWYIQLENRRFGPYSSQALLEKMNKAELDENVLVTNSAMDHWIPLKESVLADMRTPSQDCTWFYARNEQPYGPYSEQEMKEMYFRGHLLEDTWVWKQGLSDWVQYKNSALAY